MGVLLVDDNPEVQALVESTLQKSGLSVLSVNDGLSALDQAISETPDLILVDCLIKGIDISMFFKKIQRRPALSNTPIVLLGEASDHSPTLLSLAGGHVILHKPIDPALLSKEVKKRMGIMELDIEEEEEELFRLPLAEDFLTEETLEGVAISPPNTEAIPEIAPEIPCPIIVASPCQTEKVVSEKAIDSKQVENAIQKIVHEVVEKVAWEIIPSVVDTAVSKSKIQALVEQVVWEVVPPLAEIEIKKEIKRLQPDAGFSA
jgi:CheY-like chemotaxis protein